MSDQPGNDMINPNSLRAARKRREMTQEDLAYALKCSKDTVSRWERGTSKRVRPRYRDTLCDTLRVKWEKLTTPPEQHEGSLYRSLMAKVPISRKFRTSVLLAAKRYGVPPHYVLDIAPLLFVIVAERSLLARRRQLDAVYDVFDEAELKLRGNCAHLGGIIAACGIGAEDQLHEEEKSLENRDVFGRDITYKCWDEGDEGPFIHFVNELVKGLPEGAVSGIDSLDGDMIDDYTIAADTLADCMGLPNELEQESSLIGYVRCGTIDLNECMRIRRERDEDGYRQWLSDELERADQEQQSLPELFGFDEDKADTPESEAQQ